MYLHRNGKILPDEILIKPHPGNRMHEAVAVANALKYWIEKDPVRCVRQCKGIILKATVIAGSEGKRLSVGDNMYDLETREKNDGRKLPERCLLPSGREPYWVLNPGASGNSRYVISTDRAKLRKLTAFINSSALDPHSAIHGIKIVNEK